MPLTDDGTSDALRLEIVYSFLDITGVARRQASHQQQNLSTRVSRHILEGEKKFKFKAVIHTYI